jgi:hypothetical protein
VPEPGQISSEALELAVQDLRDLLPEESPPDGTGAPSLVAAMAFLRRHTPPARAPHAPGQALPRPPPDDDEFLQLFLGALVARPAQLTNGLFGGPWLCSLETSRLPATGQTNDRPDGTMAA